MYQVDVRWGWVVEWVKNIKNRKDLELDSLSWGDNLSLWPED